MSKQIIRAVSWKRNPNGNNMMLVSDEFEISYNPIAGAMGDDPLGQFVQTLGGAFNGEGEPQEETSLYDGKKWRILLGDFRKEYEAAWPNWEKCLEVYDKHKEECRSGWSTD